MYHTSLSVLKGKCRKIHNNDKLLQMARTTKQDIMPGYISKLIGKLFSQKQNTRNQKSVTTQLTVIIILLTTSRD